MGKSIGIIDVFGLCLLLVLLLPITNAWAALKYPAEYNDVPDKVLIAAYGGYHVSYGPQKSSLTDIPNRLDVNSPFFIHNEMFNYEIDLLVFNMFGFEFIHNYGGAFRMAEMDSAGTEKTHEFGYRNVMLGASFEWKGTHRRYDSYLGISGGYMRSRLRYFDGYASCEGRYCYDSVYRNEHRDGYYASIYIRGVFMEYLTYKVRYVRMTLDRREESFLKTGNLGFSLGLRIF